MKIKLYLVPEDEEGKLLKGFLEKNKLLFKEIIINNIKLLESVARMRLLKKVSLVKVVYNRGIGVIIGFNEVALNQLLEHIKKYNLRIE